MCGICGVIHYDGEPVAETLLSSMTSRLSHRGPDAQAFARPMVWVGLGHTRLKVIDLTEAAAQPMASQDEMTWLTYNGEIYNYPSLRAELEGYGYSFLSRSDTEVILHAYEEWGQDCLTHLDGMFAIAIIDRRRNRLVLARDRTGKKPLFYYHDAKMWAFASEIKALLVHPKIVCKVEERVLPLYLTYGYVPQPETFYKDIWVVPPASCISVDLEEGKHHIWRYWQLYVPQRPDRISHREAVNGLRERLTEAVRKRLASDVPLGAFLSGGIDSSIIVGIMSRLMKEPVHTFTIGFRTDDARFDETPHARLVAKQFATQHTEFMVAPKTFDLIERLIYHHDQPFGDASAIPTFLLCALAKRHVTVALNGDGGDETFAGYRRFIAAVASAQLPPWVSSALHRMLQQCPPFLRQHSRVGEIMRFLEAAQKPWDERLIRWIAYFAESTLLIRPELRRQTDENSWLLPAQKWLAEVSNNSPLSQALYFNLHEYLPNDLHVKMDRCSMAHGLETRSPFLDTEVIEYAATLPDRFKLCGNRTKIILKEAFADLLLPQIRRRGKWGFGVPLDGWFRNELREVISELLLSQTARWRSYLDAQRVEQYCLMHQRGQRNLGLQLWNLATFEVWLQLIERGIWSDHTSLVPEWNESDLNASTVS